MMFSGFPEDTLGFLRAIEANNDRAWFESQRQRYQAVYEQPAKAFTEALAQALEGLTGVPMKGKLFRIYRDVRFSKDKTPYNPWIHILLMPADKHRADCGLMPVFYYALEADVEKIGVGNFEFSKAALLAWREAVSGDAAAGLRELLSRYGDGYVLPEPELKRVPAGYDKHHPQADLLCRKGLAVWREQSPPATLTTADYLPAVLEGFAPMMPLYHWLKAH